MVSAKSARQLIADRLKNDASLIQDAGTLTSFALAAAAVAADPTMSFTALIGGIISACGAAISAGINVRTRMSDNSSPLAEDLALSYDRFQILLYVQCQLAYLQALEASPALQHVADEGEQPHDRLMDPKRMAQALAEAAEQVESADIQFFFSISPAEGPNALFKEYSKWLNAALCGFFSEQEIRDLSTTIEHDARSRFRQALAADSPGSVWMRNYLVLDFQEQTRSDVHQIGSRLEEIERVLSGWTLSTTLDHTDRRLSRWRDYREILQQLPLQKESMYAEDFGVAEVFVSPIVSYRRTGVDGATAKHAHIENVGALLAALVSTRVSSDDIVFICGGPGSGKSTLCRMLAARLAADSTVYPVFLKLRRCKEGMELNSFIEDSLIKSGVINRLADLRDVPNVVVILDGFDEIAMASKGRLRHLFTVLVDDLRSGPLRNARVVVSGRDTLFRDGDGLPRGSHVLTVLPFCKKRVAEWSENWRRLHPNSPGSGFSPELSLGGRVSGVGALAQLARWPLTLHLLARLHTAGLFDVTDAGAASVEKAYLYRAILHETATRQREQVSGEGRLEPDLMRKFLRAVAFEMYRRSVDSLILQDVVPLAGKFFKGRDDLAINELAEIAIVNSPEIQRGDDTGFEFVHKSFAEFLVGEVLASAVESICHRVQDIDGTEVWRMNLREAMGSWSEHFSLRVIPIEIQEMLDSMLGVFVEFQKRSLVSDRISIDTQVRTLNKVRDRMGDLYSAFVRHNFELCAGTVAGEGEPRTVIQGLACCGANVALVGSSAAKRIARVSGKNMQIEGFNLDPFPGALWTWLSLLHAGGVRVESDVADRIYTGARASTGDSDFPLQISSLASVAGYRASFAEHARALRDAIRLILERVAALSVLLGEYAPAKPRYPSSIVHFSAHAIDGAMKAIDDFESHLGDSGLLRVESEGGMGRSDSKLRHYATAVRPESEPEKAERVEELLSSFCGINRRWTWDVLDGIPMRNVTAPKRPGLLRPVRRGRRGDRE